MLGPDHGYRVNSSTMQRIDFWCACVTSSGDSQPDNISLARHAGANQHAYRAPPALYNAMQSAGAPHSTALQPITGMQPAQQASRQANLWAC